MRITIRKALPVDAYDFADCLISCWQSAYKGIVPDDYLSNMSVEREERVERYKETLSNPGDCDYYCVMYDEKMIGFLIIKSRGEGKTGAGEIWAIYLINEYRGKGYGKELLDFEIAELKCMGYKAIFLWVFEDNKRARHFYEKNGFRFDGTKREVTYGKPLNQLKYMINV